MCVTRHYSDAIQQFDWSNLEIRDHSSMARWDMRLSSAKSATRIIMWTLAWSQQSATIYTMQIIQSTRHVRIEQLVTRKRQKLWLINLRWVAWSTQSCFIIWFLRLSNSCKSQRFESGSCFANLHLMLKRTDFVNYYVHNAWIQILNKKVMISRELEECCKNHLPSYSLLLAIYELT